MIAEVLPSDEALSALLRAVEAGEEVVLTRGDRRVARISPVAPEPTRLEHAVAERQVRPPTDLGRPLPPLVDAKDGGFVGAVDALIAERDMRR